MEPIHFTVVSEFDETYIKAKRGTVVYVTRDNLIKAVDLDEEPEASEETLLKMPTYLFSQLKEFFAPLPDGTLDISSLSEKDKETLKRMWKNLK